MRGIVMKKLHLFLLTLFIGGVANFYWLWKANFSTPAIHNWVLNSLLVAAILGFIASKYLKSKGKLR